jgi:predicted metal-dependent hydrolase
MIKKTIEKTMIPIDGKRFPVTIHREWRRSIRFSIGKRGAIMRMPTVLTKTQQTEQMERFEAWVQLQFSKKESLKKRFFGKNHETGDVLKVGSREYILKLEFTGNQGHSAKLKDKEIHLKLSDKDTELHLQKAIKHLLSRIVAQDLLAEVTKRVLDLNDEFFQKEIRSVKLKYNQTNWGSCSSKTNINLSTRLLFAPQAVIDYVIIHELAHLIEMNHSHRFWAVVEQAMPDYQEKEKWLKVNGHLCDF